MPWTEPFLQVPAPMKRWWCGPNLHRTKIIFLSICKLHKTTSRKYVLANTNQQLPVVPLDYFRGHTHFTWLSLFPDFQIYWPIFWNHPGPLSTAATGYASTYLTESDTRWRWTLRRVVKASATDLSIFSVPPSFFACLPPLRLYIHHNSINIGRFSFSIFHSKVIFLTGHVLECIATGTGKLVNYKDYFSLSLKNFGVDVVPQSKMTGDHLQFIRSHHNVLKYLRFRLFVSFLQEINDFLTFFLHGG